MKVIVDIGRVVIDNGDNARPDTRELAAAIGKELARPEERRRARSGVDQPEMHALLSRAVRKELKP